MLNNTIVHSTQIDTVTLQLEFNTPQEQRDSWTMLSSWIIGRKLGNLKYDTNKSSSIRVHTLYSGNSKIATISTGATTVKDIDGINVTKYYIRIRIAGLKNYNILSDSASINSLITICAYLNTTGIYYRFVELDICIDVSSAFKHLLAICTQKTARTDYKSLGSTYKTTTSYIEHYPDKATRKKATKRAYVYDKQAKEKLDFPLTRFEVKLQNNWFLNNDVTTNNIINTMNRYHFMYFSNISQKQSIISRYNNYVNVTAREVHQLNLEHYRIYTNAEVITEFIRQVQTAYVDFYGNIVVPPKNN